MLGGILVPFSRTQEYSLPKGTKIIDFSLGVGTSCDLDSTCNSCMPDETIVHQKTRIIQRWRVS